MPSPHLGEVDMEDAGACALHLETLVARLDALTQRLDDHVVLIADQQAEIASLRTGQATVSPIETSVTNAGPASRRAVLRQLFAGAVAGAGVLVAVKAQPAHAAAAVTAVGPSAALWGVAAVPTTGGGPSSYLTALTTAHGVIGLATTEAMPAPSLGSGVLGLAQVGVGVYGLSTYGVGVRGTSTNDTAVRGLSTKLYGVWGSSDESYGIYGSTVASAASGVHGSATLASSFGVTGRGPGVAIYGLSDSPASVPTEAILGVSTYGAGVVGASTMAYGVQGLSTNGGGVLGGTDSSSAGAGVHGFTTKTSGYGVYGRGPGVAIYGISDSPASAPMEGVRGESANGAGVFGTSTKAFGVQGLSTNAYGVSGNSTTQAGVWGSSNNNTGVLGSSTSGVGVSGVSTSSNGVNGVNALSTTGIGIYASSSQGTAGRFDGNVIIQGNLTVSGSFPHTAAVPSSDGTLRRLFSFEGAEPYYEDLGQGSLTNGVGTITLDPIFAALVRTDAYQVFLTAYGDNRGLYVSSQTSSGFDVREVQGGTSSIGFGYRVVARPRDLPTSRLDQVTLPPTPTLPRLDRIEPLDVPATLRDLRHPDQPTAPPPAAPLPHVQDRR
jgi:hypothetical protein